MTHSLVFIQGFFFLFDDNGLDGVVSGVKTFTLYGVDVMYHMPPGSSRTRQPLTF